MSLKRLKRKFINKRFAASALACFICLVWILNPFSVLADGLSDDDGESEPGHASAGNYTAEQYLQAVKDYNYVCAGAVLSAAKVDLMQKNPGMTEAQANEFLNWKIDAAGLKADLDSEVENEVGGVEGVVNWLNEKNRKDYETIEKLAQMRNITRSRGFIGSITDAIRDGSGFLIEALDAPVRKSAEASGNLLVNLWNGLGWLLSSHERTDTGSYTPSDPSTHTFIPGGGGGSSHFIDIPAEEVYRTVPFNYQSYVTSYLRRYGEAYYLSVDTASTMVGNPYLQLAGAGPFISGSPFTYNLGGSYGQGYPNPDWYLYPFPYVAISGDFFPGPTTTDPNASYNERLCYYNGSLYFFSPGNPPFAGGYWDSGYFYCHNILAYHFYINNGLDLPGVAAPAPINYNTTNVQNIANKYVNNYNNYNNHIVNEGDVYNMQKYITNFNIFAKDAGTPNPYTTNIFNDYSSLVNNNDFQIIIINIDNSVNITYPEWPGFEWPESPGGGGGGGGTDLKWLANIISTLIGGLGTLMTSLIGGLSSALTSLINGLMSGLTALLSSLAGLIGSLLETLTPLLGFFGSLLEFFGKILEFLEHLIEKFLDALLEFLKMLFTVEDDYYSTEINNLKQTVEVKIGSDTMINFLNSLTVIEDRGVNLFVYWKNKGYSFASRGSASASPGLINTRGSALASPGLINISDDFLDLTFLESVADAFRALAQGLLFISLAIFNVNQINIFLRRVKPFR